jgi:predicted pyridoxine 5'-phosphate oxidase superfamily flavin-nucleotide-binding protein
MPKEASMQTPSSDIAFTAAVKAMQTRRNSRGTYANMEARGGFRTAIDAQLTAFLAQVDTAYLATATADGQPYAQHRGGPKGFIRVIDDHTIGFADFTGNRQYISTGNLAENDRAFLFLMDYAHRRRVKLWGRARVVEGDAALIARLMPEGYRARPEQAILFTVEAWDINCPQHIPQKLDAADVTAAVGRLEQRIATLEAENARLKLRIESERSPA